MRLVDGQIALDLLNGMAEDTNLLADKDFEVEKIKYLFWLGQPSGWFHNRQIIHVLLNNFVEETNLLVDKELRIQTIKEHLFLVPPSE